MKSLYRLLLDQIREADERNGVKRIEINLESELDDLLKSESYAIIGSSSIWIPKGKRKYVDSSCFPVSHAEFARAYLKFIGAESVAMRKKPDWFRVDSPMFYDPSRPITGEWEYVDLNSCFWQLYHPSSFDFSYSSGVFGRIASRGSVEFLRCEEWRENKLARNAVWGSIISTGVRAWRNGTIVVQEFGGRYFAPQLATWMMDVLHSVAYDLLSRSRSPLWYSDGFLVPNGEAQHWINYLTEVWGMEASVKETGSGTIAGLGNYSWRRSYDPRQPKRRASNLPEQPPLTSDQWRSVQASHVC